MPDELTDQLHRLVPEIDESAHRDLFESSRGRSGANRVMTLAAAVVLVVGGVAALIWLTGRDDTTPADDPPPAQPITEPGVDPTGSTLTEGDGYETVLVAESRTGYGNAELATDDDDLDAVWREWTPGPERPMVDFSRSIALVTTRPDNACPDTLVRFDREDGDPTTAWVSVFEDLSEACEDPLLSWIYVVAIDRAVLGDAATIVLPAQEVFEVPEQRLEYVATDAPPGSSAPDDTSTLEDTGIVLDLPEVGRPALHNTSVGLLWVVAHDDGTASVLPATVDVGSSADDAGSVTPQERLVYVSAGGETFFSAALVWDERGRTISGGRANDLAGFVGRIDDDGVRMWATDADRIDGAPTPAPDRVGTSPDATLDALRRAMGEPIDPMTFLTLSSSGPTWRYFDATLVVEGGVGRICQLPTDVPVPEQTGCEQEAAVIDTQITSGEPTITTWFHPPVLAFQDPLRGFTSFVPLGGTSSRNEAAFDDAAEAIVTDVRFECGPPELVIGIDIEFLTVDTAEIVVIDGDVELTSGTLSGSGEVTGGWALIDPPSPDAELRVSFGRTDLTLPLPSEVPDCEDDSAAGCAEAAPPLLPSGADIGAGAELVRGDTRTVAWGDLASDDVVRQYPDVDLELLPLEPDSPQLLTNGVETMHVVPVGDPPIGEIQLGLTDALGCVRHYSVGPGVELDDAIDYARRWLDAIAP